MHKCGKIQGLDMENWQLVYLGGLFAGLFLGHAIEPHLGAAFIILYIVGAELILSRRADIRKGEESK
jgi:uncharacterized membrane protein YdcZ (DUF606 family)